MQVGDPRASQGQLSPDGYWRWDGARWVPAAQAAPAAPPPPAAVAYAPPPFPVAAPYGAPPAAAAYAPPAFPVAAPYGAPAMSAAPASRTRRSWVAMGGGIAAIVGVILVIAGSIFPYVTYSSNSGGPSSSAIFNGGFPDSGWYALEPVIVILLGLAAAIVLIVFPGRTFRALCTGALIAFGTQTFLLFIGYAGGAQALGQVGAGGFVGAIGGMLLFAGGVMAGLTLLSREAPTA
jgi:hypothetical protein